MWRGWGGRLGWGGGCHVPAEGVPDRADQGVVRVALEGLGDGGGQGVERDEAEGFEVGGCRRLCVREGVEKGGGVRGGGVVGRGVGGRRHSSGTVTVAVTCSNTARTQGLAL
ncbi:hypothetical protein GCM10020001_058690 [Nonomuraea salmonea]